VKRGEEIADLNHQNAQLTEEKNAIKADCDKQLAEVKKELEQLKKEKSEQAAQHTQQITGISQQLTQAQQAYDKLGGEIRALVTEINAKIDTKPAPDSIADTGFASQSVK
jgi:DNA repair exonuclease SbcCD ATPase subunit